MALAASNLSLIQVAGVPLATSHPQDINAGSGPRNLPLAAVSNNHARSFTQTQAVCRPQTTVTTAPFPGQMTSSPMSLIQPCVTVSQLAAPQAINQSPLRPNAGTGDGHGHLEGRDLTGLTDGIDPGYPLTKTGRKKRGADDDHDDTGTSGYAVDPPEDVKHPYKSKSYHIRRAFSLFADIHAIMNDGIKRRAREAIGIFVEADCLQSARDFETFNLITNHLDGLDQDIIKLKRKPKVFRKLIRGIRQAADQGRNNDTANLKRDIACMLTEDGSCVLNAVRKGVRSSLKSDRGFYNDIMGKFLCPITLDWDDPRVRQEIRDGKHAIKANKIPRLLYANCECNVDDLEQGLGRNQALLKVVKYIFTGRSSAFSVTPGGKTTRAGNAALAGMREITPRVVAYSACMLRFAISTEESWSKLDNEFNMEEFYWYVVDIFDDAQEFGRNLLAWWNMQVFGTSTESISFESPNETDFISLLKEQRAAKRAKILRDACTNIAVPSPSFDETTESHSPPQPPRSPYTQATSNAFVHLPNPCTTPVTETTSESTVNSQAPSELCAQSSALEHQTSPSSGMAYSYSGNDTSWRMPLTSFLTNSSNSTLLRRDSSSILPSSMHQTPSNGSSFNGQATDSNSANWTIRDISREAMMPTHNQTNQMAQADRSNTHVVSAAGLVPLAGRVMGISTAIPAIGNTEGAGYDALLRADAMLRHND